VLYAGGVITLIKEYEGWAFGCLDGIEGLFPLNYTEPV